MVFGLGRQPGLWLGLVVTALHLALLEHGLSAAGAGAADAPPARIAVAFVRELSPAQPPARQTVAQRDAAAVAAWAPVPAAPSLRSPAEGAATSDPVVAAATTAASAASAEIAASAASADTRASAAADPASLVEPAEPAVPAEAAEAVALATEAAAKAAAAAAFTATPAVADPPAPAPAEASPPASSAPVFDWPPSTRLNYRLSGDVRGPIEGQARVEWLRSGVRYQVHLDVSVGPSFAPFMSRTASSEGTITADGLRPARFDEVTRIAWRGSRLLQLRMDDDSVTLAGGRTVPRPEGLQDTASQFVQLTWLFTTQPGLLRPGQVLALPLALPRRVLDWRYEVGEPEWLETPAGWMWANPVRPAPDVAGEAGRRGDLVPEAWFAPTLQYLPVRILIRQPGGGHVDLRLEQPPLQAAPAR